MTDEITTPEQIHCPRCKSTNWRCWNDGSDPCWGPDGSLVGYTVYGDLACNDCGAAWRDYTVNPEDDEDCECEYYG